MGWWLDLVILEIFSNINDSMILWSYEWFLESRSIFSPWCHLGLCHLCLFCVNSKHKLLPSVSLHLTRVPSSWPMADSPSQRSIRKYHVSYPKAFHAEHSGSSDSEDEVWFFSLAMILSRASQGKWQPGTGASINTFLLNSECNGTCSVLNFHSFVFRFYMISHHYYHRQMET